MDFLVEMSGEVEGVIRKVLPELRIAVKRRQHIKEQKGQHMTYKKGKKLDIYYKSAMTNLKLRKDIAWKMQKLPLHFRI